MGELQERLARSLEGRYRVEGEIGRGGMATVFVAEDLKHQRKVAVKVLHPELAAALGSERFLREIQIAARLQHPHIVPLYDSGEADGLLYYLMPFVDGESLGQRLEREGRLGLDEAMRITLQVADALDYAHRAEVVHRDIKPDNIMLSGNHALVTDFGIATAVSVAGGDGITRTGVAIGTPAYMSPEQVDAERELDGRTDLYSLGCVLYEIVSGEPPYTGGSPLAILAKQARGEYEPLLAREPDLPPGLDDVIAKALVSTVEDRFATASAFAEALREAPRAAPEPKKRSAERSIAVLPFTNTGADPAHGYFGDGMAEDLINALARLPSVKVAARTSSFAFKGKEVDVRRVGEQLDVATVLEGSVRHAGDAVRLTAQLVSVADGYQLWAGRFDRTMTDLFGLQDELTAAIVEQLRVQLTPEELAEPLVHRGTDDPQAYQAYMKGRHAWNERQLPQAIEHFQAALASDPSFALPYAGLADSFTILASYGFMQSADALAKATGAAQKAVALDPGLAEGHFSQGVVAGVLGWDLELGIAGLRRALEANPRSALSRGFLATFLGGLGRVDKARAEAEAARELEPLSPVVAYLAGFALVWARAYDRAREVLEEGLELDPAYGPVRWALSIAYSRLGRHEEALEMLEGIGPPMGQSSWVAMLRGELLARAGHAEQASALVASLDRAAEGAYVPPVAFAWVLISLGRLDEALDYLREAYAQRNVQLLWIAVWDGFEAVHEHAGFEALFVEAGLGRLRDVWGGRG